MKKRHRIFLKAGAFRIALVVVTAVMLATFVFGTAISARASRDATRDIYRYDHGRYNAVATSGAVHAMTSARGMATIEMTSGRVLYAKNAGARLAMASTTKIATAITVLENVTDVNEIVTVNPKAIGIEGTSIYLQKGEKLSVLDLLYGVMLRSGNDASTALALHVSKSVDEFGELMNQTARKAGAMNTNFKNPHGLDEEGHYTTALDLARITAYAMHNEIFAKIVSTKEIRIPGVDYPRILHNKNRLLRSLDGCVGVKTGFTSKAGRCFVGAREEAGMTVICVVLNCGPMFPESEALMEQAGREYYMHCVLAAETVIRPTHSNKGTRVAMVDRDYFYPLRPSEIDRLEISINEKHICVFLDDKLILTAPYIVPGG